MPTAFLFIDATKTDAGTRRKARSHAMKGKNVGKKHYNRRTKKTKQSQPSATSSDSDPQEDQYMQDSLLPIPPVLLYTIGEDFIIPMHLQTNATPQSQHVIRQFLSEVTDCLNPPALCYTPEHVNHWLSVLFSNQAAYHCTMALMGTLNRYFFGRDVVNSDIVSHLTRAVVLVNQSLDTHEATCDANIYVVNFMIVHELLNGAKDRALVHLRGLQKMTELRGGIVDLEPNLKLLAKVCKTDLDVTLHFGTPPVFYRDEMADISSHMASWGFAGTASLANLACYRALGRHLNPYLQQILLDACNATAFFTQGYRMDPHMLQETIASFGYRLVRFQPVGAPLLHGRLDSICHIALTALTTTLFFQIGRRRLMQYELVGKHLKDVVVAAGVEDVDPDVRLWLLFVGGVSVLPEREESWLLAKIRGTARDGLVRDWEDARRRLMQFPWIASLHDLEAERFWYSAWSMA